MILRNVKPGLGAAKGIINGLILAILFWAMVGCGVYLSAGKDNLGDELKAGGGLYLFNGWDNIYDCERAWKGEIPPTQE